MAFRSIVKRVLRVSFYLFLATLPFTFQAYIAGAMFAKYRNDKVVAGIKLYLHEVDSASWLDTWSIPGAPSIRDFQNNGRYPFYIQRLTSSNWRSELGLTAPYQHLEDWDLPIDRYVAYDDVVRDVSLRYGERKPTEFWVYVTSLAMPEVFPWDMTFVRLLEWHEMHPLPEHAAFAYVDCATSPFMCDIWQVQHPALVHLKVDESGSVDGYIAEDAFISPRESLRPVEVRIFDLGLRLDVSPFPPGVFPSMFEQMKALTTNENAYALAEEYSELHRAYDQFNEHVYFPACNKLGSFLDHTSDVDNWLLKHILTPIGLKTFGDALSGIAFILSLTFTGVFYAIANPVSAFWDNFLGERTEADFAAERLQERQAVVSRGGWMGDMHLSMLDMFEDFAESKVAESSTGELAVTTAKKQFQSLFAGLRTNISSVAKGA